MTSKKIFIINGSGGRGKDTFVKMCCNHLKAVHTSKVIPAKRALCELLGISMCELERNKTEEIRSILVDLNKLAISHGDYPTKFVMSEVDTFLCSRNDQVLFIDIREPEEIDKIKALVEMKYHITIKTILVVSDRVKKITSNTSDANVDNYTYDYQIDNSGNYSQLSNEAKSFCKNLDFSNKEVNS